MRRWILAIACVGLLSCTATGVKVQQAQLDHFVVGQTTRQQVTAVLGAPTGSTKRHDGTWELHYRYLQTQLNVASYIPIANLLAGGMKGEATTVILEFDTHERLTRYTASQAAEEMGTGLLNGGRQ